MHENRPAASPIVIATPWIAMSSWSQENGQSASFLYSVTPSFASIVLSSRIPLCTKATSALEYEAWCYLTRLFTASSLECSLEQAREKRFYFGQSTKAGASKKVLVELQLGKKGRESLVVFQGVSFAHFHSGGILGGQLRSLSGELDSHVLVLLHYSSSVIRSCFVSCRHFILTIPTWTCFASRLKSFRAATWCRSFFHSRGNVSHMYDHVPFTNKQPSSLLFKFCCTSQAVLIRLSCAVNQYMLSNRLRID
ncbi:hypothetical protein ONS95_015034 [Cadophora gregata]|uniref:uncharacterized protein n=1 Tax=Cadophora gregata TaxID=51156 RepID=UPI0026DB6CF2|nr:uncharacterized protein ONS95_015034 [Cadophora gregata]KAK0103334.1 hypothetical protein ONS95_015034 [Cadophora gregata]KAK0107524.1 hypothetical protein ONS96_014934 [Cadophora gregata f. sp. sojae]